MEQRQKEKKSGSFMKKAMNLLDFRKKSAKRMLMLKNRKQELDNALFNAAENGDNAEISRLIKAGADILAINKDSQTPLYAAVSNNHIETCALLIDAYSKAGGNAKEFILSGEFHTYFPFFNAVLEGRTEICALLLNEYEKAGGDKKELITKKDLDGNMSLHKASITGNTETCAFLLDEYEKAGG
ncbi:MAG: ankyrin repeat domain-containing protein, partial [Candidatus Micrarchaeota archaeon]|nr:ankyrin repeat domain-containing protein [Candidatus Micrarchaeota archaeon]